VCFVYSASTSLYFEKACSLALQPKHKAGNIAAAKSNYALLLLLAGRKLARRFSLCAPNTQMLFFAPTTAAIGFYIFSPHGDCTHKSVLAPCTHCHRLRYQPITCA
jgi:hypothetical protein